MVANHLLAKIKLQAKNTCALHHSIGLSWFQAIEPEFKKPYFGEVCTCFFSYLILNNNDFIYF